MWADLLMGESKVTAHKETWVCMGGGLFWDGVV